MKISNLEVLPLEVPMEEAYKIANVKFDNAYVTIIKITTDNGITGIGECIARISPRITESIVKDFFKPILIGRDPLEFETLWQDMYNMMRGRGHSRGFFIEAIAGVDIAIWDIIGKYHKLPIAKLLGGSSKKDIEVYASSLMHKDIKVLEKEAESLVEKGYKAIKLKIGLGIERDISNITRIRKVIGYDIKLMVDANSYYKAFEAIELSEKMKDYDIYWFEEPVPTDDIRGYERVNKTIDIPIAAGESEFTAFGFRDLLERDALDVVQPNVTRAGGFTECKKIIQLAHVYNKYYAPQTGMSSGICIVASMHLSAAASNFLKFEYMYLNNPLLHIFKEPIPEPKDSICSLSEKPGLGYELDEDKIKKYILK